MNDYNIQKHSKNLGILTVKEIPKIMAKEMMVKNHYSKKWNSNFGILNYGIFKDSILLGCAVYGNLMNPKSYENLSIGIDKDSILELNRLWISDKLGKNAETILISSSFKLMKKYHKHIKIIQSFADGRLGCGTIYKASNFKYFGYDNAMFFENKKTGEITHAASATNRARPHGFMRTNLGLLRGDYDVFTVKSYRYLYSLCKKVKINLKEQKYPDYEIGMHYKESYEIPIGIVLDLYLLCSDLNYDDGIKLCFNEIDKRMTRSEFTKHIEERKSREYVKKILYTKSNKYKQTLRRYLEKESGNVNNLSGFFN